MNWELLIIDDGSTDNSAQIIKEKYLSIYSKIKLISVKQNMGIVEALNKGICSCDTKSKYIARMDADDISLNNRIETQIKFMINNPNIDVLGTGVHLFDNENDQLLKTITYKCLDTISIKWSSLFFCPINHPTVIFKKIKNNVIHYDNVYNHCEDYHLWFKLLFEQNYKFANLDQAYLKLRKNQSGNGNNNSNVNISKKYHDQQLRSSVELVQHFVNKQISLNEEKYDEIDIKVIDCIQNPKKIKSLFMFKQCYQLLEKWEKCVTKDYESTFVKNDCDARMAELISLCMQSFMMDAIQMMQKWKLRNPSKQLINSIL